MSNPAISLVVALDGEYKDEDLELIIRTIKMINGISSVISNEFSGNDRMNAWAYKQQWLNEAGKKFIESILEEKNDKK